LEELPVFLVEEVLVLPVGIVPKLADELVGLVDRPGVLRVVGELPPCVVDVFVRDIAVLVGQQPRRAERVEVVIPSCAARRQSCDQLPSRLADVVGSLMPAGTPRKERTTSFRRPSASERYERPGWPISVRLALKANR